MVIIEVSGGLGNQMFQYALYRSLEEKGKDVRLDISHYQRKQPHRSFELDFFSVPYRLATPKETAALRGHSGTIGKIRDRVFCNRTNIYQEDLFSGFQPQVFDYEHVYLSGYWQCEEYFKDIQKEIREAFTFPTAGMNMACRRVLKMIEQTNAVSIHVRRGDYLQGKNVSIYGNICTKEYYEKGIAYIRDRIERPIFYLFTDDAEWVKENLYQDGMVMVECNSKTFHYDMYLMSRCRHNIVANSSFSWWGAWLNENRDKLVLAPDQWLNGHDIADVICPEWIRIK